MFKYRLKKLTDNFKSDKRTIEFTYQGRQFILKKLKLGKNNKIVISPKVWKQIHSYAMPSQIHYQQQSHIEFYPQQFNQLQTINNDKIKILLISGKNNSLYIHPHGSKEQLLLPEDQINGIHIITINDIFDFLKNYINYIEFNNYKI